MHATSDACACNGCAEVMSKVPKVVAGVRGEGVHRHKLQRDLASEIWRHAARNILWWLAQFTKS